MKKEDLTKFYQKYRFFIFPTIVALSSLFLIVFAIFPQTAKLISNQRDQGDLMNKSAFLESKVSALESYNNDELSLELQSALNAFPGDKDFGVAMDLLQQLAGQSGFKIATITLGSGSSKPASGAQSYQLKLEMIGTKPALPILLNSLEDSPRLIRVSSINFSSNNNSQAINATLVVEVLYAAVPQSYGSLDSPLPELSDKDKQLLARLVSVSGGGVSQPTVSAPSTSVSISTPRGRANPFE